jgi:hypothetical protein
MPIRIERHLRGSDRPGYRRANRPASGAAGGLRQRPGDNGFDRSLSGQKCIYGSARSLPKRGVGNPRPIEPVPSGLRILRRQGYIHRANLAMALNPWCPREDPTERVAKNVANRSPSVFRRLAAEISFLSPPYRE